LSQNSKTKNEKQMYMCAADYFHKKVYTKMYDNCICNK
jgi:hypothetical protein